MRIIFSEEFKSRYEKLPLTIQKKAEKQEIIFRDNPFHPSLNTEKLEPKKKEMWSIRIDKKYRAMFRFIDGNTAYFLTIGPHDWIYKLEF